MTEELERLAKRLGGGWRMEQGLVPVLVLTLPEARQIDNDFERIFEAASAALACDAGKVLNVIDEVEKEMSERR